MSRAAAEEERADAAEDLVDEPAEVLVAVRNAPAALLEAVAGVLPDSPGAW